MVTNAARSTKMTATKVLKSDQLFLSLKINSDEMGENEEGTKIYIYIYIYKMKSAQKMKQHPRLETEPIRLSHVSKHLKMATREINQ